MTKVDIKPELLRWARERARLEIGVLEKKFSKLRAWEAGEDRPTLKQLERLAKATHAPIGYFFLPEPPKEQVPIPDFRTINNETLEHPSPDLLETIYLCQQRQEWYRENAMLEKESTLDFIGSAKVQDSVIKTAAKIREALGLDVEDRRQLSTWTDALRQMIEKAETAGVLMMASGVVGSNNRRNLNPEEFRGFALSDPVAPVIFLNGADTKAAQMFTLGHELAHLWLGESGVSDSQAAAIPEQRLERWCNQVAAELLVPKADFKIVYDSGNGLQNEMQRLARHFKVSTLVVLRRILDVGGIDRERMWTAYRQELKRLREIPKGSGGNFYLTLGARAGKRFSRALVVSAMEGRTTFTESFRLLGLKKMASFQKLGRKLGMAI